MKNWKVIFYSFIALIFIALTFTVDWLFILGAIIIIILNQRAEIAQFLTNINF